jgi:predicted ATP-dependent serine protease
MTTLVDRQDEREAIGRLIAAVGAGESRVLVLYGSAGIGKSALLDYARQNAAGFRVLRVDGTESEMELAFAAVHQPCRLRAVCCY